MDNDYHAHCRAQIKELEKKRDELLMICKGFIFLEKTNMTKKQVQLRIDIAKQAVVVIN